MIKHGPFSQPLETIDEEQARIDAAAAFTRSKINPIPQRTKEPVVYIITGPEGKPVKIGITQTPRRRLTHLQIGNWKKLEIYKLFACKDQAAQIEQFLHVRFYKYRITGEWFDLTTEQAEAMIVAFVSCNRELFNSKG